MMSGPTDAAALFDSAHGVLAGGVSAAARIHPYLERPFYQTRGTGPYIEDLTGRRFIDFNMSNGAALLGHDHPAVREAVTVGLALGIIAGAETAYHERLARTLTEIIPAAERVRFATNGSDVTMIAVRLARHATGRTRIVKFDGHYHGLTELFLFRRDESGAVVPSSGGVPPAWGDDVLICHWNDAAAFEAIMARHGDEIAAVICEPVHYNAGCIPPAPGFLALLRERTRECGSVLIFDEVLSGFRMALGGVQEWSGVTPDLCTLAKALSNGMPLAAVAGRADLMAGFSPSGPVAHSGTYSGHPLSILAGQATLDALRAPGVYDALNALATDFYRDLQAIFDRHGVPVVVQGLGARFGLYFGRRAPVTTYADAVAHNHGLHRRFVVACLERGLYLPAYTKQGPPGHNGFSLAHTPAVMADALAIMDGAAGSLRA
jgi:glutamate-1-semialdehyde 2,1-aminomutase